MSEAIANYEAYGATHAVFASTRNGSAESPQQWQFLYRPLLVPIVDQNGDIVHSVAELPSAANARFRILVPLVMYTQEGKRRAVAAVRRAYEDGIGRSISESNVRALPVDRAEFSWPDLENLVPEARLVSETQLLNGNSPTEVSLRVDVPSAQARDDVLAVLPASSVAVTLYYASQVTKVNSAVVDYSDLRTSGLYAFLDGTGTDEGFVHRDDVRQLLDDVERSVSVRYAIEDPDRVGDLVVADVIQRLAAPQALDQSWTEERLAMTFNGDDLRPDELTRTLNRVFRKDQGKYSLNTDISGETSGKVGLLEVLSAEGAAKGEFTETEMKEWLKEHDITAEVEGSQIVVKALDVQRFNVSDFRAEGKFSDVAEFLAPGPNVHYGQIDFTRHSGLGSGASTAEDRLTLLEQAVEALRGAVVPFASEGCPSGWSPVDEAKGRMIVGVGEGGSGTEYSLWEQGGSEEVVLTLEQMPMHTHRVPGVGNGSQRELDPGDQRNGFDADGRENNHHRNSYSSGGGEAHPNMPPFLALTFCRMN